MKEVLSAVLTAFLIGVMGTVSSSVIGTGAADMSVVGNEADNSVETAITPANPYATEELDANGRFIVSRKITVEIFDRDIEDGTPPDNNYWSNWIKDKVLEDLNIEIEWVPVPRWGEEEQIVNLLASGTAPDVCLTYNHYAIMEFGKMGGVHDMAPYIDGYKDLLPNLWGLLGETNMHAARDPKTGRFWFIEGTRPNDSRTNTFVREDWLKTLNIPEPTSLEEFEAMLVMFKENAFSLLGDNAAEMVPFSMMNDVGWRANNLLVSFVPDGLTDKEAFIYGYDDRQFMFPGYKEGVRVLNKWYNMGLICPDFFLYSVGGTTEENNIKAGNVGSFIHNWDMPYRNENNGIQAVLKANAGEDAAFIAIDPFKNDAGVYRKFKAAAFDRKLFFPVTNKEPLASALYLDWISRRDVIEYLQIGDEGVTHRVTADGAIEFINNYSYNSEKNIIDNTARKYMQNSLYNTDYTMSVNGLYLQDTEKTGKSLGFAYPPTDRYYIGIAYARSQNGARVLPHYNIEGLESLNSYINTHDYVLTFGDLTITNADLADKRDALLNQAVAAPPDKFDAIYDAGYQDYLDAGGQAIIDERAAAYTENFE